MILVITLAAVSIGCTGRDDRSGADAGSGDAGPAPDVGAPGDTGPPSDGGTGDAGASCDCAPRFCAPGRCSLYGEGFEMAMHTLPAVLAPARALAESVLADSHTIPVVHEHPGIGVGNEVLVVWMAGPNAGRYVFRLVREVTPRSVTLDAPTGLATETGDRVQIVRVEEYGAFAVGPGASVTIPAWNGRTGGVAVIRVTGTVTIEGGGSLGAGAVGFRGGAATDCSRVGGAGESTARAGFGTMNANASGGGGGGPACDCAASSCAGAHGSGGGGGHVTAGAMGDSSDVSCAPAGIGGEGGHAYTELGRDRIYLGGGGGGAGGAAGAAGGGILFVFARAMVIGGTLDCAGGAAAHSAANGGGGGGAGGTLVLGTEMLRVSSSANLVARGGVATLDTCETVPTRGLGGDGRVLIGCGTIQVGGAPSVPCVDGTMMGVSMPAAQVDAL